MRVTRNRIYKAIKEKHGLDVKLFQGGGVFHFYSDDEKTGLMLSGLYSTTVYMYRLSDQSVDNWVKDFDIILKEENRY